MVLGGFCCVPVVIILLAEEVTTGVLMFGFVFYWIGVATVILGGKAIKERTAPLGSRLREIAGYQLDVSSHDTLIAPLIAMGVVPKSEKTKVLDALLTKVGPYVVNRLEISSYDRRKSSKGPEKTIPYFKGDVIVVNSLPPCPPLTILFPSRKRRLRRLRRFMMAHADPAMRQEETYKTPDLGTVSVFGDGSWDQENVLSPDAQVAITTICDIGRSLCDEGETLAAAHFGKHFCAVANETQRSRFSLGGLLVTRAKMTRNVDRALLQLGRSFGVAEVMMSHATQRQDQSS